jgi:hypothetical protein
MGKIQGGWQPEGGGTKPPLPTTGSGVKTSKEEQMPKRKAKRKSPRRAKPSKVQRTLARLEKVIVAEALRVDDLETYVQRINEFLGPDFGTFPEKQTTAPVTNGPQLGPLTNPE